MKSFFSKPSKEERGQKPAVAKQNLPDGGENGQKPKTSPKAKLTAKTVRLLWEELLLFLLFSGVLLFFEYASAGIFGAAYPYVAMGVWIFYLAAIVLLLLLIVIFNRGVDTTVPEKQELVSSMTEEEKDAYIAKFRRGKQRARRLLAVFVPLAAAFLLDLASLFLF